MSRNVKDLRDLVCVSRLSVREYASDSVSFSESSDNEETLQAKPPTCIKTIPHPVMAGKCKYNEEENLDGTFYRKSCREDEIVVGRPKSAVGMLPRPTLKPNLIADVTNQVAHKYIHHQKVEFVLEYVDATIMGELLQKSTSKLNMVAQFLLSSDNFVRLCSFYFNHLSGEQKKSLIDLEYSIVKDELYMVFRVGIKDGVVVENDINKLLKLSVPEYPDKLLSKKNSSFFLTILYKLCNVVPGSAKALLTNVEYSSRNKNHIQWILGTRAFSLISIVDGVLNFYQKANNLLLSTKEFDCHLQQLDSFSILESWIVSCIQLGYKDVLEFVVKHLKGDMSKVRDKYKRNMVMVAVVNQKLDILNFMLSKVGLCPNVNQITETGNTPLHVAVTKGSVEMVKVLLDNGADPNVKNVMSDGGTPLHSAVLNGNLDIVKLLVSKGACIDCLVGGRENSSPVTLAKDIGEHVIASYLEATRKTNP